MQRPLSRPILLVAALCLLAANAGAWLWIRHELRAGHDPSRVAVAGVAPAEADDAQVLTVLLDRPLGGKEGPDASALFRWQPPIPGDWTWAARDRLAFRMDAPLPPGRTWQLLPAAGFASRTGLRLADPGPWEVRTRALALAGAHLEPAEGGSVLVLNFNQPVDRTALAAALELRDGSGRRLPIEGWSGGLDAASEHRLHLPRCEAVELRLAAGLAGAGATRGLPEEVRRRVELPPAFALVRTRFAGFADSGAAGEAAPRARVELRFSRRLDTATSLPPLRCTPPVTDLEWSRSGAARILVTGAFRPGIAYALHLPPALRAAGGTTLGGPGGGGTEARVRIPHRDPEVRFLDDRGTLSPRGRLELAARATNVARLRLRAWRLHENNLAAWLHGLGWDRTARALGEQSVPVQLEPDRPTPLVLDLRSLLGGAPGLYRVEVEAPEERWVADRAVVAITDLGLTARHEAGGLLVWTCSLTEGRPVAGVEVVLRSATDQVLARGRSGQDGTLLLPAPVDDPAGRPWLITARRGADLAFLELGRRPQHVEGLDAGGRPPVPPTDVFLYPDRGVVQPGAPVHFTGIVRDRDGGTLPPLPLVLHVERPDGVEVATLPAETGAQGILHAAWTAPSEAWTGSWRVRATLPGGERTLGRTELLVESYVPLRLEMELAPDPDAPPVKPAVQVAARFLHGAPAAGLPVRLRWRRRPAAFRSAARPDCRFGRAEHTPDGRWQEEEPARLDPQGGAVLAIAGLPETPAARYQVEAAVTVTEPGGRSRSERLDLVQDAAPAHLGIALPAAGTVLAAGGELEIPWCLRDPADRPAPPLRLHFRLERVRRRWLQERVHGRWTWVRHEEVETLREEEFAPGAAAGTRRWTLADSGRFRLVAQVDGADEEVRAEIRVLEPGVAAAPAEADPNRLALALAGDPPPPGGRARVVLEAPFAGHLLLTLEEERVLWHEVRAVPAGTTTLEVPVPASLRGDAFVAATLVRPVVPEEGDWLPHRVAGALRLAVDQRAARIDPVLRAPPRGRPGEEVEVAVALPRSRAQASPGHPAPVVHLWAVDEGALQAAGWHVPDPFAWFHGRRALAVTGHDSWGELLPERRGAAEMLRIGGDEDRRRRRRNPVPGRRRQVTVLWHEAAPVDADGVLRRRIRLPGEGGALRLLAVAADGDRYGAAELRLPVVGRVDLAASWPRFLAPGDRLEVPLRLTENEQDGRTVDLAVRVEGGLRILGLQGGGREAAPRDGAAALSLDVERGRSRIAWLLLEATGLGPAAVTAEIAGDGAPHLARSRGEFPVRPAGPLVPRERVHRLAPGQVLALDDPADLLPGATRRLFLGTDPRVSLAPVLDGLLEYPYGCTEQLASRGIALLHARDLLGGPEDARGALAEARLQGILDRLRLRRLRSGALPLWPGGRPDARVSAYAAEFLAEARAAGFPPPDGLAQPLRRWLLAWLDGAEDDAAAALACRALAAGGALPPGWLEILAAGRPDPASRAHLAVAWLRLGRPDRARELLAGMEAGAVARATPAAGPTSAWRTPIHDTAVVLDAFLQVTPDHPAVPLLARQLEEAGGRTRSSTLDRAALVRASSRYLARTAATAPDGPAPIRVARPSAPPLEGDAAGGLRLAGTTGQGPWRVEAPAGAPLTVAEELEGLALDPAAGRGDRGLRVRRRWLRPDGSPLAPGALQVGDLVRVEVTLQLTPGAGVEVLDDVVVVDALPAACEVENPRLAGHLGEVEAGQAEQVEFLDDRVLVFTGATAEPRRFAWLLRIGAAGRFVLPPVQASSMGRPDLASVHGDGTVEVRAE